VPARRKDHLNLVTKAQIIEKTLIKFRVICPEKKTTHRLGRLRSHQNYARFRSQSISFLLSQVLPALRTLSLPLSPPLSPLPTSPPTSDSSSQSASSAAPTPLLILLHSSQTPKWYFPPPSLPPVASVPPSCASFASFSSHGVSSFSWV
jgi:hypothetical protein